MAVHKKSIRPVARLHGYWLYRTWLQQLQGWSLEQRQKFVLERLRRTLISAQEGIPFYRERFQQAGFDPSRHFKSAEDLAVLPLLTKQDVRERGAELVDRRFLFGSVIATTSGTTGHPTELRLGEKYVAVDYACMFRHWAKAGYRFRSRYAAVRSYVPKTEGDPLWKFSWAQNTLYMSAYHLTPANSDGYIGALLQFRPEYIRGYASSLNVLAEYAYPYRDQFGFVRGVFTASETLLDSERATIERAFGKKLYDWYGMTEPAVVITERPDHEGMEVDWEYGFPEFETEPGLEEGERKLIATSLHNPVMPLIRYDTGDRVLIAEEASPGRLYPRIKKVLGRKDECLLGADGRRMPSLNFYSLLQDYHSVLRFQFVQSALDRLTVRLSIRPGAEGVDEMLAQLRKEVVRRVGPDFELKLELTDDFVRNRDGKTPTFARTF